MLILLWQSNYNNLFSHYHITKETKNTEDDPNTTHTLCATHDAMNRYDSTLSKGPRQDLDTKNNELSQAPVPATSQKKHTHQWWLTCTRPKMIWERAVRRSDTLHRRPGPHRTSNQMLPLWEWTRTSIWETHDAPRNEQVHAPHTRGVSPFPTSLFHPFHFHNVSTGALYNK